MNRLEPLWPQCMERCVGSALAQCPLYSHMTYSGFCSMKRLGVFFSFLDGYYSIADLPSSNKFSGTHLYTSMKKGTVKGNCLG